MMSPAAVLCRYASSTSTVPVLLSCTDCSVEERTWPPLISRTSWLLGAVVDVARAGPKMSLVLIQARP